jgi:hypothetical protein
MQCPFPPHLPPASRVRFKTTLAQFDENKDLIRGILQQAVKDEES